MSTLLHPVMIGNKQVLVVGVGEMLVREVVLLKPRFSSDKNQSPN